MAGPLMVLDVPVLAEQLQSAFWAFQVALAWF
jgi:hypothetical protein